MKLNDLPNHVLLIAIAKAAEKAAKEVKLLPATYPVDDTITLHVEGSVKKAEDTTEEHKITVPTDKFLALALEAAGVDRAKSRDAITTAMAALLADKKPKNKDRVPDAEAAIKAYVLAMKVKLGEKSRSGATNVNVEIEVLEPAKELAVAY